MNNLKKSVFNFTYKRSEGENVIYNTFSKGLVVLGDVEFEQYENLCIEDEEIINGLVDNGMLIKKEYNEMAFLKYFHYKTKFAKDALFLTIAPTLDCNFGCPYCYENRRHGKMSVKVQDAIIEFIAETVNQGATTLNITWYGGEPLLYFSIVEKMSEKIVEIAKANGCKLVMDMVTNGYLLTEEIVERLDELGIIKVQITLDGMQKNHDKRRHLLNGGATFDKIVANLKLFDDSPIAVLIRMNVDNENYKDFGKLKALVAELKNSNVKVYASPVEDINKDKENSVSEFMSNEEFDEFTINATKGGDLSEDEFSVMDDRYCFCTAETENCYVVDEKGNFYKCWDEVGRTEYRCFNILDDETYNYFQIAKFVANDPFSDEKCANCVFLPICFGGCQFQKAHLIKSPCGFTEKTMINFIENTFFK